MAEPEVEIGGATNAASWVVSDGHSVEGAPVTPGPARTSCRYGAGCHNFRDAHRARFAHPGDPDHPDTVTMPLRGDSATVEPAEPDPNTDSDEDKAAVDFPHRKAGFNRHLAILLAKASCLLCILVTVMVMCIFTFNSLHILNEDQQLVAKYWWGEKITRPGQAP
ncbi:unnamed protein product, partial [Effrenium voratum]